jgi:hypothetical protein
MRETVAWARIEVGDGAVRPVEKECPMSSLAVDWQGEYAAYDRPEDWLPELGKRGVSAWILGQMIRASHNEGRFRTSTVERSAVAGSTVRLRVEGITPLAPLAVISGRMDGEPLSLFGKVVVSYEETLDALVGLPPDSEGGTYVFLAQQWEPGGQPAYPGGSLIHPSSATSVEVRPHIDDEKFWESFEPWSEEDAEEIMRNVRSLRKLT